MGWDSLVGTWILDQYLVIRVLAEGGMGRIYLAEQAAMDRYAAVKILSAKKNPREGWRRRFRQEARAVSRLAHPNIVTVYNFGELADGSLFLAMEYVEGQSLAKLLQKGPLPIVRSLDIASQCARALGHAHQHRVIHRDLKPENVMLMITPTGEERAKLVDFGIARLIEDGELTKPGELLGTPRYFSPEQCRGDAASPQSDQYSLGLVIYEMLVGQPAVVANSTFGYIHGHQHVVPPPPSKVRRDPALEPLDPILERMLAKQPHDRFASMAEVVRQLQFLRSSAPLVEVDTQVQDVPRARLAVLGRPLVPVEDAGLRRSFALGPPIATPEAFPADGQADLYLFGLGVPWDAEWRAWDAAVKPPAGQTLCWLAASSESAQVVNAAETFQNLVIGSQPPPPTVVLTMLAWLQRSEQNLIEHLPSDHAIQILQVSSLEQKSTYVDALLDDARAEGVRRQTLQSIAEVTEEMIMNAVFHAPSDPHGDRRLRPGEEATLRWTIGSRYIAVSLRDEFGTLSASQVLRRVTGGAPLGPPYEKGRGAGMGMGLRIMSRAARHLIFAICPDSWCEVLALIDREPSTTAPTLGLLRTHGHVAHRLGDRLRVRERRTRQGATTLELRGELNETCDLRSVFDRTGVLRIDLSGIDRINSMGIRAWIDAALTAHDLSVLFERCSLAWVRQMNILPSLAGAATVVSFHAPYYCASCQADQVELLKVEDVHGLEPPARSCIRCRGAVVLDAAPKEYFAFLADRKTS